MDKKADRFALRLSLFSVGYNLVEGLVSVAFALDDGSAALLGFGADSFVESLSGAVMIWRFWKPEGTEEREYRAARLVGVTFLILAAYVAYGIAIQWIGQVLINIGVNVGLLPTKGLTLPFLSYGGSSLIVCCVSLAMLLRIEWERRTALGTEEIEFSESDFFDAEEVKHAR